MTNKNMFEIILNRKERKHFDEHVSDFKIVIESTLIQACTHVCICVHMFIDLCVCGSLKLPLVVCRYQLLIYCYNLKYVFVISFEVSENTQEEFVHNFMKQHQNFKNCDDNDGWTV